MDDHNQNGQGKLNDDQVEEQSKATSGGSTDPQTPVRDRVGARNHKRECECRTCQNIRRNAQRANEHRMAGKRVRMKDPKKQIEATKRRTEKEKMFVDVLATQATSTGKLSVSAAGEIAGYSSTAANEKFREDRIRRAFLRALYAKGVTIEKISEVIAAGLDAKDVKVLSKDGVLTGTVEVPNWLARHKFVETGAKALQLIEDKKETGGNVAVFNLIAPVVQVPGHEPGCRCDKCEAVRQREREKLLARENYVPEEYRVRDNGSDTDE